jgi:hypothetical protein
MGADQNFGTSPVPSFSLYQFLLLNACTYLCRMLGTRTAPRGGSPYPRMHSPNETFCVEVVGELVTEFQKLEEQRSQL